MTDKYRWIPGYPGYDCNENASDVRSYWMRGTGGVSHEPVMSIKAQQKGAATYYALRRNGKTVQIRRPVIRDLAWGGKAGSRPPLGYNELRNIRRDVIGKVAMTERSAVLIQADLLVHGIDRKGFGVSAALEVLAALGMRDDPQWRELVESLRPQEEP